jgi:hypothetical protein
MMVLRHTPSLQTETELPFGQARSTGKAMNCAWSGQPSPVLARAVNPSSYVAKASKGDFDVLGGLRSFAGATAVVGRTLTRPLVLGACPAGFGIVGLEKRPLAKEPLDDRN